MIIHKSFSKADLIEIINTLDLKVVFSHQDNKRNIHSKLNECLKDKIDIKPNLYNIENKDGLIQYLQKQNTKKTLTIREKNDVMSICKKIIQYCKNDYFLECTKYKSFVDLKDDMDYIKQFGDIPSVRRCCRLMNSDPSFTDYKFIPLISPDIQKLLDEKRIIKTIKINKLVIKRAPPGKPFLVRFD